MYSKQDSEPLSEGVSDHTDVTSDVASEGSNKKEEDKYHMSPEASPRTDEPAPVSGPTFASD